MLGGVLSGDLSHIGLPSGCCQLKEIHQNAKCFAMEVETAHADLDPQELCQRYLMWCVLFKPYLCLFFVHVFKTQSVENFRCVVYFTKDPSVSNVSGIKISASCCIMRW